LPGSVGESVVMVGGPTLPGCRPAKSRKKVRTNPCGVRLYL